MNFPISLRSLIFSSSLSLASCAGAVEYFGNTSSPHMQKLIYSVGGEPEILDPAKPFVGGLDAVKADSVQFKYDADWRRT